MNSPQIYLSDLMQFLKKIPRRIFFQINKLILKILWKCKDSGIAKIISTENYNKVGRVIVLGVKAYHKYVVFKIGCYWDKHKQIDQWNRIDRCSIYWVQKQIHIYVIKLWKRHHLGKGESLMNSSRSIGYIYLRGKKRFDFYLIVYTTKNFRRIIDSKHAL